ncbi:MAG: hypothetical protein ACI9HE_000144 [Planctomycetota bacterium]|jgi:hypothetical protein
MPDAVPRSVFPDRPRLLLASSLVLILGCGQGSESSSPADGPGNGADLAPAVHEVEGGGEIMVVDPPDPGRPYFHDFGTLPYGEVLTHTFTLHNASARVVNLLRSQAACACTRVTAIRLLQDEGTPIRGKTLATEGMLAVPPGGIFEVDIELDSTKAPRNIDKLAVMRIVTDSELDPYLTFELHMLAQSLFELSPASVKLGLVPQYGGKGTTIQLFSRMYSKPARILEVIESTPGLEASLALIPDGSGHFWNLTVRLIESERMGGFLGKVVLSTTDEQGEGEEGRLEVSVSATVVDPILMTPQHVSFGAIKPGEKKSLRCQIEALLPGQRFQVMEANLSGPSAEYLKASIKHLVPDSDGRAQYVHLTLEASEQLPLGLIEANLEVLLDDESIPRITRRIRGVVR